MALSSLQGDKPEQKSNAKWAAPFSQYTFDQSPPPRKRSCTDAKADPNVLSAPTPCLYVKEYLSIPADGELAVNGELAV
jgi:hypothetical protein